MSLLLKAKRGGAVPFAIFFTIFFIVLSIVGSIYLSVGVGNPANKVIGALLSSTSFKEDAGDYFVSKTLETAKGDERKLLSEKAPQISAAVTVILSNPDFSTSHWSVSFSICSLHIPFDQHSECPE